MPPPKLSSLIEFVEAHDPAWVNDLRRRYPDEAHGVLRSGILLGATVPAGDQPVADLPRETGAIAYVELALAGLSLAKQRTARNVDALRARLRRAKRVRLIGALVAAITGAGLLGAAFGTWPKVLTVATAVMNLVGTALTLTAGYMEASDDGSKVGIAELFATLVSTVAEADTVIASLELALQLGSVSDEVMAYVQKANVMAESLRRVELELGTSGERQTVVLA